MGTVLGSILAGILATVTMDALAAVSRKAGFVAGAKGRWVGRWYLGMTHGRFVHTNIVTSQERPGETQAALLGHYVIGIVLAVFYFVGLGALGLPPTSFMVAIGYGLATCVFPWLLVYPALGFGTFGRGGPPELKLFTASLLSHSFYGFGLWWSAHLIRLVR